MKVNQISSGIFLDDKEIISVELINSKENKVTVLNYGTIIHKFLVKNANGKMQDIVLGFDDIASYLSDEYLQNYPYLGAIIGRYANRIKDAKFSIDGEEYQLPSNDNEACLHGGLKGFDRKVWDIVDFGTEPNPRVTFQYLSFDGEENFPGDLGVQATFEYTNNDELILTLQADTDEPTAVNLTHHSYFNLSEKLGKVTDHFHQMNARFYLEQDANFVATGKLLPVEGTAHNFTAGKLIGEGWDEELGYDQTYVIDKPYGDLTLMSKTSEGHSGLSLTIYSTEPVVQFYTAKYLKVKQGKNGKDYNAFDGFCVEPQHHPNAVNIADFPSTVLYPEEIYRQTTIYKISNEKR